MEIGIDSFASAMYGSNTLNSVDAMEQLRAGTLGLPLMVAVIGGETARFRPLIDLYREAGLGLVLLQSS